LCGIPVTNRISILKLVVYYGGVVKITEKSVPVSIKYKIATLRTLLDNAHSNNNKMVDYKLSYYF